MNLVIENFLKLYYNIEKNYGMRRRIHNDYLCFVKFTNNFEKKN